MKMNEEKRILILGAGNAQIDAIEYCKAHGYKVVGCSYTTVDCGIPHLDYFEQVDIKSMEGVADLARRYGVRAIYSVGSDLAMPTVMKVSEMLGLPHFISYETAETCHSKGKLREALGQGFEGNASFITARTLEEALEYTDFPGMMKPVDSQGQRGCFKVESADDIREHFAASLGYSFEGKVIVEEFIDGPAYYQIKLRNGTDPVLLEVTPRLDGCHMWNLIRHYCGADLLDACFRHLLEGASVLDGKYEMPAEEYSLAFMSKEPNTRFARDEFDTEGAEHVCYYYDDGDRVLRINGYIEKCGYVIRRTGRTVK